MIEWWRDHHLWTIIFNIRRSIIIMNSISIKFVLWTTTRYYREKRVLNSSFCVADQNKSSIRVVAKTNRSIYSHWDRTNSFTTNSLRYLISCDLFFVFLLIFLIALNLIDRFIFIFFIIIHIVVLLSLFSIILVELLNGKLQKVYVLYKSNQNFLLTYHTFTSLFSYPKQHYFYLWGCYSINFLLNKR